MTDRQEVLKRMKRIEDYFQRNSLDNVLFQPEFLCAKTIRERIETIGHLTTQDAEDLLKIYNETNAGQHYDGSGWFDYQLHLRILFKIDNLKAEVDFTTGRISINAG